jgi:hypothetical protein
MKRLGALLAVAALAAACLSVAPTIHAAPAPAATLAPAASTVAAGDAATFTLNFAQTGAAAPRAVELRVVDKDGVVAWAKVDVPAGTIRLHDPLTGRDTEAGAPGSAATLETAWAVLSLADSSVDAAVGRVTLALAIKADAANRAARVELRSVDEDGEASDFAPMGTLTITNIRW